MSVELTSRVWRVQFPTANQKLIMLRVADFSSPEGFSIFASNAYLAQCVQCDERTIRRSMKAFRDCGLLHLMKEGGNGPHSTNEYWLNVFLLGALADQVCTLIGSATNLEIEGEIPEETKEDIMSSKVDILSKNLSTRGTKSSLRGTPVSAKGDTMLSPNTSIEVSLEKSSRASARELVGTARASRATNAEVVTTPTDVSWQSWLSHFEAIERADLAEAAKRLGKVVADARWPEKATFVFEPKAGDITKRLLGEANQ